MSLSAGSKLGPYEVVSPLGAGGMGEVYRAKDTRLDRTVAIKVLPDAVAHDKERVLRFEREAKLLAALSHSNVAAIYGFEEATGQRFLVLEYVEGETLAARLKRGGLPVEDALEICVHIARALEAAHEKGIVHRDLKPGNVMIKPDGSVKVLDFGLARAMQDDSGSTAARVDSPTITADYTRPGVILGTAAYMSPEQARGRPVDRRSDIWSFGVILYECLTGEILFRGETAMDSLGAIMHRDPDWAALPPQTPPAVQLVLRRCLTKDRDKRLHDIADARIELESAINDPQLSSLRLPSGTPGQSPLIRRGGWLTAIPWMLSACFLVVIGVLLFRKHSVEAGSAPRVLRLSIPTPVARSSFGHIAISPNGEYVVYRSDSARGNPVLHFRPLNEFSDRVLTNTVSAFSPFISPDGADIGFFTDRDLRVISASGGTDRRVCEAYGYTSGVWCEDGTIIFSTGREGEGSLPGLSRVCAAGGTPEVLTTIDPKKKERAHGWPFLLPDGKHLLFSIETDKTVSVAVLSLETREYRILVESGFESKYAPSGQIIFVHPATWNVYAAPFDLATLELTGRPVRLTEDETNEAVISRNGMLAYIPLASEEGNAAVWVDRQGQETAIPLKAGPWSQPRISPDGSRLVLRQIQTPNCILWLYEFDRSTLTRLTFEGDNHSPVWDRDGKHVLFGMEKDAMRAIYSVPVDGSSAPALMWRGKGPDDPGFGAVSSGLLPFVEENPDNNTDIWILSTDGQNKATPFLQTPFREFAPAISVDGKWVAYTSNESGRDEIYVRAYPGAGARTLVSTEGGTGPLWSKDGKELFYASGKVMMAVDVTVDGAFHASAPHKLFEGNYAWDRSCNYDVSPDGKRFVMIKPPDNSPPSREIRVVLNWAEELKSTASTGSK